MLKELERPEVQKIYTTEEIAMILDVSTARVRNIANYYHIEHTVLPTSNSRAAVYSYDAMRQIKECYETMKKKSDRLKLQQIAESIQKSNDQEASENEHPLVTDKRFLKLSYFPETTPSCFEE